MPPEISFENLTCPEIFALLSQYLDAELPPDLCERIGQHIGDCQPCVQFVASLRQSIELCREFPSRDIPPPLAESAREQLWNAYRKAAASNAGPTR